MQAWVWEPKVPEGWEGEADWAERAREKKLNTS